jgi:hypothetical protein
MTSEMTLGKQPVFTAFPNAGGLVHNYCSKRYFF